MWPKLDGDLTFVDWSSDSNPVASLRLSTESDHTMREYGPSRYKMEEISTNQVTKN